MEDDAAKRIFSIIFLERPGTSVSKSATQHRWSPLRGLASLLVTAAVLGCCCSPSISCSRRETCAPPPPARHLHATFASAEPSRSAAAAEDRPAPASPRARKASPAAFQPGAGIAAIVPHLGPEKLGVDRRRAARRRSLAKGPAASQAPPDPARSATSRSPGTGHQRRAVRLRHGRRARRPRHPSSGPPIGWSLLHGDPQSPGRPRPGGPPASPPCPANRARPDEAVLTLVHVSPPLGMEPAPHRRRTADRGPHPGAGPTVRAEHLMLHHAVERACRGQAGCGSSSSSSSVASSLSLVSASGSSPRSSRCCPSDNITLESR